MFKYVRQGKIGGVNSFSLDHQVIFNVWVPAYLELKAQERENIHATKKSEKNNILNFNWDGTLAICQSQGWGVGVLGVRS